MPQSSVSPFFKERLLTPGPTEVPPVVLLEMAKPIIHHRTKAFQGIFEELSTRLQALFRTRHPVLTLSGSGTTAHEAAQISLTRRGSRTLTVAGGKFGERWQDIYEQYAHALDVRENIRINVDWGSAVAADRIEAALKEQPDISVVSLVHSETSTATAADLAEIARVVQGHEALLVVDGVTSVGSMPVEMDEWGVDVLVTGSQKALMLPPGLGFVGLGERALRRLEEVEAGPYYNLDLRRWLASWKKHDVPFTPPVSLIRGQRLALEMIEEQGLENVWARTARLAQASRAAFEAMGLRLISTSPSDSVTGAFYPEGVDDSQFRAALRDRHGVHIAGGQDGRGARWKGKIFRISHMGYVDGGDTLVTLTAIETELNAQGYKVEPGTAVAAASRVMAG